jgi:hypothetical protein
MALAQVGKYMPEGLRALANLMNMLFEAAAACKVPVRKSAEWYSIGLNLDRLKYWGRGDLLGSGEAVVRHALPDRSRGGGQTRRR